MPFQPATDISPKEKQALTEMRAGFLWSQGFFAHLLYEKCTLIPTRDVPYAATDGKNIYVNPGKFAELNVQQRIYVLAHEVCHVMWEHCQDGYALRNGVLAPSGMLPYDHELVNICQDFTINAFLDECKVGEHPPEGHFSNRYKGGESWVGIYDEEYRKRQQNPQNGSGGTRAGAGAGAGAGGGGGGGSGQSQPGQPGSNPGGFDDHLQPGSGNGKTPQQAIQERKDDAAGWQQAINQAAQVAKARGELPAAIQRLVEQLLHPEVDWKDKLAALVVRNIGGGDYDWKMPDPTMLIFAEPVYTPRRTGKGVGTVVIGADTSGSVGQREMSLMGGAMAGIFEQAMPESVHVIYCDARVHGVHELDSPSDVDAVEVIRRAQGGGGTCFEPVFDKIEELDLRPDVMIYLTDGYGSFPQHAPNYPVIWAITPDGQNSCPWGEVVELKV